MRIERVTGGDVREDGSASILTSLHRVRLCADVHPRAFSSWPATYPYVHALVYGLASVEVDLFRSAVG